MAVLVTDCPRCNAEKMTFDLAGEKLSAGMNYGWQMQSEGFSVCRNCNKPTIFLLTQTEPQASDFFSKQCLFKYNGSLNQIARVDGFISIKDFARRQPPDYLPDELGSIFKEGATCLSVNCFNAAGTMFRLCVDLATQPLLPSEDSKGLNGKIRRDLGLRIPWLFENGFLSAGLRELSNCIKDDGNDGAHRGTLLQVDAEDLCDFTFELLERLYTEPERLKHAAERKTARRVQKNKQES